MKLLSEALNALNIESEIWRYPNRQTNIGKLINQYLSKDIELDDHSVHLLFSANRWETVDQMKQKLNNGTCLIVDRYAYSGVAYTAAKPGFDLEWCKQCDTGLPKPDLVCFMDSKKLNLNTRECFGNERYEVNEFQTLVYNNFKKLFHLDSMKHELTRSDECLVINASDSIESIHSGILNSVLELIKSNKMCSKPLNLLW